MTTKATTDAERAAVRIEEVFDTDIDDLWEACTTPERLARWIAEVSGDLRLGGTVHATFSSSWSGECRIDACEAPHHLLLTQEPGTDEETQLEAWLAEEGGQARLVVEERGLPVDELDVYGVGWQVHVEDLGRHLGGGASVHPDGWSESRPAAGFHTRWRELASQG